jgi:hypothetical protein
MTSAVMNNGRALPERGNCAPEVARQVGWKMPAVELIQVIIISLAESEFRAQLFRSVLERITELNGRISPRYSLR